MGLRYYTKEQIIAKFKQFGRDLPDDIIVERALDYAYISPMMHDA